VKENGRWYEIDDDKVRDINMEQFNKEMKKTGSSNAYILFYSSLYS
jgi:ubiquitin C-terminal hydrolase